MKHCDIIPLETKACTGKCKGGVCPTAPRIWILAACGGMISLFEKTPQGAPKPVSSENAVFASLEKFQQSITAALNAHAFDQLVIVGSKSDTAWVHASLPAEMTTHIAAEIEYPFLPAWFKQPLPMSQLAHALESVFTA